MGVINLDRREVEVKDVELGEEDYEGDNEDIMRMSPEDFKVETAEAEE